MSRKRKPKHEPGTIFRSVEDGALVHVNEHGEEEPWAPEPYDPFAEWDREPVPDPLPDLPRRADGTVAPFYTLDEDRLEAMRQETARSVRRTRHDGWTPERQKNFIERLAATASVTDAARYVGKSRQSARDLYNRSPHFRAAWDEAVKSSVAVLAETAFDRAVNGVQEQVWYRGQMVGFREKYDNRLLMFLLRVRDPLNFAPLDDLQGWQRHRALDDRSRGLGPILDRLEAAEKAWSEAHDEPAALPRPADRLEHPSTVTSLTSSAQPPLGSEHGLGPREQPKESAQAGRPAPSDRIDGGQAALTAPAPDSRSPPKHPS